MRVCFFLAIFAFVVGAADATILEWYRSRRGESRTVARLNHRTHTTFLIDGKAGASLRLPTAHLPPMFSE